MKRKKILVISVIVLLLLAGCGAAVVLYLRVHAIDPLPEQLSAPPELRVVCGSEEVIATSGNYTWDSELSGIGTNTIACGMHPLDAREYTAELAQVGTTANLMFDMKPTTVEVRCWKADSWGNTAAESEKVPVEDWSINLMSEAAIYEVTAKWENATLDGSKRKYNGTASYTFYTVIEE